MVKNKARNMRAFTQQFSPIQKAKYIIYVITTTWGTLI